MTNFAIYKTTFGLYKITYDNGYIVQIARITETVADYGVKSALSDVVFQQLEEYFNGKRKRFDFRYKLAGTDFQQKVWRQLTKIPYGQTRSYKDIAIAIGRPSAYRAVGTANNKNPLSIVVPCHRVIGSGGKLVGYAGGLATKLKLLKLEGAL